MLVRFSSIKTESITMFGDIAVQLIKMLGASGSIPGAIAAKDIPFALQNLQRQLQSQSQPAASSDVDKEKEPPIALATRAHPLIDLLKRAATADVPVMWEKA